MEQYKELQAMMRLQENLDTKIFTRAGLKQYPRHHICLALITELGELLQETPDLFKFWKQNKYTDRDKLLEEYIDCMHFVLSLSVYVETTYNSPYYNYDKWYVEDHSMEATREGILRCLKTIIANLDPFVPTLVMPQLFMIGHYLGFEWVEIYEKYNEKNSTNHRRQEEGY